MVSRLLLRALLPREEAEFILGDLEEDFQRMVEDAGAGRARRWYRRQAAGTLVARVVRRPAPFETWRREGRLALRRLVRSPGYSVTAVGTLALSIGGVLAITALAAGVLRPLPLPDPDALVAVWETRNAEQSWVAPANYIDWRRTSTTFSGLAAHDTRSTSATVGDLATRERVVSVSSNFFDVLGVPPALGRGFDPTFDTDFAQRVAVLSHRGWEQHFGARPDVIGQTFLADDVRYEVIGVTPEGFTFPDDGVFAWLRSPFEAPEINAPTDITVMRDAWYFQVVGRLSPGADVEAAAAEMDAIASRLAGVHPETNRDSGVRLVPLLEQTVAGFEATLAALVLAVALILLGATLNVLQLTLARAESRERETAVCVAIGADRHDLRRSAMIEGWLVGLLGASIGLVLAQVTLSLGIDRLEAALPRTVDTTLTPLLLAMALALGAVAGSLIGGSLIASTAFDRRAGRPSSGLRAPRRAGRGHLLIATQVAVVITVGSASGLLGRSLSRLAAVDLGFEPGDLITLRVAIPDAPALPYGERIATYVDAAEAVRRLPGVESVGLGSNTPLTTGVRAGVRVDGVSPTPDPPNAGWQPVDPEYFTALGMTLLQGRAFERSDGTDAEDVAIVNQAFVRQVLADREPLGARVTMGLDGHDRPLTIVGVVADTRTAGPAQAAAAVLYRPLAQTDRFGANSIFVAARTVRGSATTTAPTASAAGRAIRGVAPGIPVYAETPGSELSRPFRSSQAVLFTVMALFAGTALLIGLVGVSGVALHAVRRRRSEIGVRMAFGATRSRITQEVVTRGLHGACLGVVPGLVLAALSGRALDRVLFDVGAADPTTLIGVACVVVGLTVVVLVPPARLAASVDPARSTRQE